MASLLLTTCSVCRAVAREIDVEVRNDSSADITNVQVYFGEYRALPGADCFVGKGFSKTVIGYSHASVNGAEVEWSFEGKNYRKKVALKQVLPRKGRGTLIFAIRSDTVSAKFEPKK